MENWSAYNIIMSIINTIMVPVILHYTFIKNKRPVYTRQSYSIASNPQQYRKSLTVFYGGIQAEQLTKTVFRIWNSGRKSIRSTDLLVDNPFGVRCKGELLDIKYTTTKDISKSFNIEKNNNDLIFTFDSMPKNEGILLEILHTGNEEGINIMGNIDEAVKIRNQKKIHLFKLIVILVFLFLISILVLAMSVEGMKAGEIFGLGLMHGSGAGLNRFASEMGIIGIITLILLIFTFGIMLFKYYIRFLPESIERLHISDPSVKRFAE